LNYIIGSGLVAFLAKIIFPTYTILPIGKSRYYQFNVATCDDYITCHKDIDDFINEMGVKAKIKPVPVLFKRALSYGGQIIFGKNEGFLRSWAEKVYGTEASPHINKLTSFDMFVYNIAGTDLFSVAEDICKPHIRGFVEAKDKIKSIDIENKVIYTAQKQLEYDTIINTIPLDAMLEFCGTKTELNCADLHTFVVETQDLDFEGVSELLVVDEAIDFFKCTRIGKTIYQFYSMDEIINIPAYLDMFIQRYDILSATVVRKAMPRGPIDTHKDLEQHGIYSVGSNAQWDDMMDLSSCIRRLLRMQNGH
jgi:hypothetical protein